jgi:hypothetical protein
MIRNCEATKRLAGDDATQAKNKTFTGSGYPTD